jgi:hypothetical protein
MVYKVARKYVPPAGKAMPPGEHYTVVNESREVPSFYREISFYRTAAGREVATDGIGYPLAQDGDLFRLVKAAVERYDAPPQPAYRWPGQFR